ncbi:MAG: hypothetical protein ACO28T_07175, partial [Schleiferiaceae bacterium]
MKRSDFLKTLGLGAVGALTSNQLLAAGGQPPAKGGGAAKPLAVGTRPFAEHTTRASLEAMQKG